MQNLSVENYRQMISITMPKKHKRPGKIKQLTRLRVYAGAEHIHAAQQPTVWDK